MPLTPYKSNAPAPLYKPIDRKMRKGKTDEDKKDRAASANEKASALVLKPASPTPSNTVSKIVPQVQREGDEGPVVL